MDEIDELPDLPNFDRLLAAHEKGVAIAYEVLKKGNVFRGGQPEGSVVGYDPATDPEGSRFFVRGYSSVCKALFPRQGIPATGVGNVILDEPRDARPTPGSFITEWDNLLDERLTAATQQPDEDARYSLRPSPRGRWWDGALDEHLADIGAAEGRA